MQRRSQPVQKIFLSEWLGEEAYGAGFQRAVPDALIGISRDEDDGNLAARCGEVFLQSRTLSELRKSSAEANATAVNPIDRNRLVAASRTDSSSSTIAMQCSCDTVFLSLTTVGRSHPVLNCL
jgi:hypothetical protein